MSQGSEGREAVTEFKDKLRPQKHSRKVQPWTKSKASKEWTLNLNGKDKVSQSMGKYRVKANKSHKVRQG